MPVRGRLTWRLLSLAILLFLSTGGLVVRLVQLQVVEHGRYAEEAFKEHFVRRSTYAARGPILDRDGHPLATSVDAWDIYVDRHAWEDAGFDAQKPARALAAMIQQDPDLLISNVRGDRNGEVLVASGVNYVLGGQIIDEGLMGVRLESTSVRVYPEGGIASGIIGYLGRDRTGLAGLEQTYEDLLKGEPGLTVFEKDAIGNQIAVGQLEIQSPQPGGSVVLTIDRGVQRAAERALDTAIATYSALGGSIIVMDPNTGEILALTSRPSVDNTALDFGVNSNIVDLSRVRAVSDLYEPGSPFKLITMAAALNEFTISPGMTYYDNGLYSYSDKEIRNWDKQAYGTQTVTEILKKSLNTGAIWAANTIGPRRFYDYLNRFGFNELSGIDLPGEGAGRYRLPGQPEWSHLDLATNSFGQGINVTPIEMINAIAAIANGGELMRPHIVKEIHGVDGVIRTEPEVIRRVISEETSATLREMMVEVVDGLTTEAGIPGYRIAGKTGTSSIYDPAFLDYNPFRVIVSFTGIVPADNPRFVVLVKIDEPAGVAYGSTVAGPVFRDLAVQIVSLLNVQPDDGNLVQRGE